MYKSREYYPLNLEIRSGMFYNEIWYVFHYDTIKISFEGMLDATVDKSLVAIYRYENSELLLKHSGNEIPYHILRRTNILNL